MIHLLCQLPDAIPVDNGVIEGLRNCGVDVQGAGDDITIATVSLLTLIGRHGFPARLPTRCVLRRLHISLVPVPFCHLVPVATHSLIPSPMWLRSGLCPIQWKMTWSVIIGNKLLYNYYITILVIRS